MAAEHAFAIDSNVGRYWLANGEGFDVVVERGPRLGVVEDVVVNPLTQEVSSVVVRRRLAARLRRSAKLGIGDLTAVLPESRRFLVAPPPAAAPQPPRTRAALTRAQAKWPTLRDSLALVAARVGDALIACVAVSASVAEWTWRTGSERLRESGLEARSRARRLR